MPTATEPPDSSMTPSSVCADVKTGWARISPSPVAETARSLRIVWCPFANAPVDAASSCCSRATLRNGRRLSETPSAAHCRSPCRRGLCENGKSAAATSRSRSCWCTRCRPKLTVLAGGKEWNSPAYDPRTNLILVGDVDWCTTVRMQTREEIVASPIGQFWVGEKTLNPFNAFGKFLAQTGTGPDGSTPWMPTPASGNGG